MSDLLAAIVAATRCTVETRRERQPIAELERRAGQRRRRASTRFGEAIRKRAINVIAECKRRSPSKGLLSAHYDPVAIARTYDGAGAAAISVVTEPSFFDGSLDHLRAVGDAVDRPLLRKDFIVDEYQLMEAAAAGADAVLLIVAALEQAELTRLHALARQLDLDVLVEVHDVEELGRAVDVGAAIVGVNNRNLRTLRVDVRGAEALAARLPEHATPVAESGLQTPEDVARLHALGYRAFLIGERLMTADDPSALIRAFEHAGVTRNGACEG